MTAQQQDRNFALLENYLAVSTGESPVSPSESHDRYLRKARALSRGSSLHEQDAAVTVACGKSSLGVFACPFCKPSSRLTQSGVGGRATIRRDKYFRHKSFECCRR
jgi:hypothetical protein